MRKTKSVNGQKKSKQPTGQIRKPSSGQPPKPSEIEREQRHSLANVKPQSER